MKWIFSLLANLWMASIHSRELILITYEKDSDFKDKVEKMITEDLKVPAKYLNWKKTQNSCDPQGKPLLQICLLEQDFMVVQNRPEILRKTLGKIIRSHPQKAKKENK